MPNGDPRDGLFYPTLTLMINSYNIYIYRKRRTDGETSGGYSPDGNPGTGESNFTSPYGNGESNSGPNGNGYVPNMPNDGMQFW